MKSVLFLTYRLTLGYGVDVAVQNIAAQLRRRGVEVTIGALEISPHYEAANHVQVAADEAVLRNLAANLPQPCLVVAHTSPFFELLPALANEFEVWAYEYGDPTPELFDHDADLRRRIVEHKQIHVYPHVNKVIAISEFIRHDIGWRDAEVIYCGVHSGSKKNDREGVPKPAENRLQVGTLMRLGSGEARYKGNSLYLDLVKMTREEGLQGLDFHVAGRTTDHGVEPFQNLGIRPHLNLSDSEKSEYLRSLDVFLSFSLWEGFNLPLAEAQSEGTFSLAFDTGAHPEVCPFIVSNLRQIIPYLQRAREDRDWLTEQSQRCHAFVRDRFTWSAAANRFCELANIPA